MKLVKKVVTGLLSSMIAMSMASTSFAMTYPHLKYGTEKMYGEDKTQHKLLSQEEYDFGKYYAILPKTDTFSFEREDSIVDDSHNVTITWWAASVENDGGKASLLLEGTRDMKTEKFKYGQEYPVYPDEVKNKIISQEEHTDSMGVSGYYNEYNAALTNRNEPIIVLAVEDHDIDYSVYWVYQVVDNWTAPVQSETVYNWLNDEKGWWVQKADGTYLTNSWYQSPSSGLWYYMGADGYMLTNTTTPDGYKVNAEGVWIQ